MRFAGLAALLVLAGCNVPLPDPKVEAENAWVQLPVVPGRPGSAYFTLVSNNEPTKLVSVTSSRIERIELHETVMENGVSRMRPPEHLAFPENLKMVFAPGGRHAMLFGIDPTLKAGDTIPLTFTFEPAPPVTVEVEVRAFGGDHADH